MKLFKKLAMAIGAGALALMPVMAHAVDQVTIESVTQVGNVTQNVDYAYSVNAHDDDVVKVQVTYHNMEDANSGKIAQNLKVKIDVPSTTGATHTITGTASADNSNTVVSTATVNTNANSFLEYIPGSAKWRHNTGTNANPNWVTEGISDQVANGGLVLENEKPCFNFAATVTILARVKAPLLSINKYVRVDGTSNFVTEDTANAGDTLDYEIRFKNEGNTKLTNVIVGDNLPPNMTYINGSAMIKTTANPNGGPLGSDNITHGGVNVGDYEPGSVAYVLFKVKINDDITCGDHLFKNVGFVRADTTNDIVNVALTHVTKSCGGGTIPTPPTPSSTPLPQTGAEATSGVMGLGALGYATRGWIRSKRNLLKALKNKR